MPLKRLNARFVATVTTSTARAEFRDLHERGLELRVTREGIKTWVFRYRRKSDGKKRTLTLGRFPTMSVEEARIRAQEERARIARGSDPASGILERSSSPPPLARSQPRGRRAMPSQTGVRGCAETTVRCWLGTYCPPSET